MADDAPGVDAWKEHTSAFDRVRSIASTLSQPRPASFIAAEAHVAENTARDHLDRLVDMNVLLKEDHEGTAMYAPDPLHTRLQTLRDLLDTHDHDGLVRVKAELQEQIETWCDEYGVESPAQLRERAAETEAATATREIREAASDWELVQYRLSIVEDAIENYATYSRDSRASA
jgi:predicted ArsR family transcriptional regulator